MSTGKRKKPRAARPINSRRAAGWPLTDLAGNQPQWPAGISGCVEMFRAPTPQVAWVADVRLIDDFTYHQWEFFEAVRQLYPEVLTDLKKTLFGPYKTRRSMLVRE